MAIGERELAMTKITYDDFIDEARRAAMNAHAFMWMHDQINDPSLSNHDDAIEAFVVCWVSGGIEGGNCWNEGGHQSIAPEEEPELDPLIDTLEKLEVSLRDGRKILGLTKTGSFEERGYYGNYTRYSYKYVPFDAIFDKLVELDKAEPRVEAAHP